MSSASGKTPRPDKHRGRGTPGNPPNRFIATSYERFEEWDDDDAPAPGTEFIPDSSRSIIATNESPDIPYDFSVNAYRGCEHGCVYCYARPYHEYLGYSSGLDFETKILVKRDAAALLRAAFMKKSWKPCLVEMSGVTDPYQPVERKLRLTRACLEVFAEFRNPVGVITKNALVARDIDILARLASDNLVQVILSITTLKPELAAILEPRTSVPARKLRAVEALRSAGIPVGVMVSPIIPGLTDEEIPAILAAAAGAGAMFANYTMLRLQRSVAVLFEEWLERHMPDRKDKILNRVRSIRGGTLGESAFGKRMRGEGPFADNVRALFAQSVKKNGLDGPIPGLRTDLFARPAPSTGSTSQLDLFT